MANYLLRKGKLDYGIFTTLNKEVEKVIEEHKIFIVYNECKALHQVLERRGWLQKFTPDQHVKARNLAGLGHNDDELFFNYTNMQQPAAKDLLFNLLVTRLLVSISPDLVWVTSEKLDWKELAEEQLVSKFPSSWYIIIKDKLYKTLQNVQWFQEIGSQDAFLPRCFAIKDPHELEAFLLNYHLSACVSFLKLISNSQTLSEDGEVPADMIKFSVENVLNYIQIQEHDDIDRDLLNVSMKDWQKFHFWFKQIVCNGATVKCEANLMEDCVHTAINTLEKLKIFWPQLEMEGSLNLWILKPVFPKKQCNVTICTKLNDILAVAENRRGPRMVIQKYIERPYLICGRKFNIWIWFLVTNMESVTIWIYNDFYIQFCSKPYDLEDVYKSVDLSKHVVHHKLVSENNLSEEQAIWEGYIFLSKLIESHEIGLWRSVTFPGIKTAIIGALLTSQEHICRNRKHCFQLYEANFVLSYDFHPWLIEINSNPLMTEASTVTSTLYERCLEDVFKVVIDKTRHRDVDTGRFGLIYKQEPALVPPFKGTDLLVRGFSVEK